MKRIFILYNFYKALCVFNIPTLILGNLFCKTTYEMKIHFRSCILYTGKISPMFYFCPFHHQTRG